VQNGAGEGIGRIEAGCTVTIAKDGPKSRYQKEDGSE
jgi:lysophospholipid acyltransferase (LPLAT)-like uncharacterized protein